VCDWCNEATQTYCQDCRRIICQDMKGLDDVMSAPYVTESGDLYCLSCGSRAQREQDEQDEAENEFALWDYDTWDDIIEGEQGGRSIGPGSENAAPEGGV